MNSLPVDLYDAEGCRALDRLAIEEGIPGFGLMQRAGEAAFQVLQKHWPETHSIAVVCGGGNNGGDGYIVAALAANAGVSAQIYALAESKSDDARQAEELAKQAGVPIGNMPAEIPDEIDLIVDGLFGTGLDRAPEGKWGNAIGVIMQSGISVLALDIPSGLNSDTGAAPGKVIEADVTITFIGLKTGLLTGAGQECSGKLNLDDLQVPQKVFKKVKPVARRLDEPTVRSWLPGRRRDAHKGANGHIVIIGGNYSMAGAVRMAGEAAYRSGAGLVSVVTRPGNMAVITSACPEIMVHETNDALSIDGLLKKANVVAVGPGLGQDDWSMAMLEKALNMNCPVVCDADALNLLALEPRYRDNWILTPHPGEAARLLMCSTNVIQRDRPRAIHEIINNYGGTCVLKGSGTLVATKGETLNLCDRGNPGMATGGMGDVLTGVIAGLAAQGMRIDRAATTGVFVHASAGDRVAELRGERGMMASDLLPEIRNQINQLVTSY